MFGDDIGQRDNHVVRTGDREYQNNLFTDYLGRDNRALRVYGALTGNEYDDSTEMQIYNMGSVLYNDLYNDLSFVIDGKLVVFFEDQTTPNPNMPVRMLEYLSRYYEDYTKRDGKALIYSKTLVRLPKPEFIVFYNGEIGQENEIEYRLTDAFEQVTTLTSIELTVKVYNINYGAHTELLTKSRELHDYASLIHKVKHYLSESNVIGTAIALAVRDSIAEGVMVKYLKERREETYSMLMTQYAIDAQIQAARHDERVEMQSAIEAQIQAAREDERSAIEAQIQAARHDERVEMQSAIEAQIQAAREDERSAIEAQIQAAREDERSVIEAQIKAAREDERREAEERLKESVRSMKAKGYPVSDITEITGLSAAEIEAL